MKKKVCCEGFTLIELALSLVFIAVLSMTVVLLIQNTTASYRRGLILNQVNTVGMDLVDDFRSSLQNASSVNILKMCETFYSRNDEASYQACKNDHGNSFVSVTKRAKVTVKFGNETSVYNNMPVYGAFCTGTYTYIWNSGYYESTEFNDRSVSTDAAVLVNSDNVVLKENFRLLKVFDTERTVCVNAMKAQDPLTADKYTVFTNNKITNNFKIDKEMIADDLSGNIGNEGMSEGRIELLSKNNSSDLVLYDLYVAKPAFSETRNNFFYSVSFILGTRRGGINITRAGNVCKPPSDDYTELEYCAINKFNFAVQAGGQ